MITTLIAGNWKMNGLPQDIGELKAIKTAMHEKAFHCDILLCVPAPLIMLFAQEGGEDISIGAQDCHEKTSGAHTGDMSAQLLKAVGAKAVIVGHSERRMDHHETSQMVARKALAAQQAGLFPIICVGETLQERDEPGGGVVMRVCPLSRPEAGGEPGAAPRTLVSRRSRGTS